MITNPEKKMARGDRETGDRKTNLPGPLLKI